MRDSNGGRTFIAEKAHHGRDFSVEADAEDENEASAGDSNDGMLPPLLEGAEAAAQVVQQVPSTQEQVKGSLHLATRYDLLH